MTQEKIAEILDSLDKLAYPNRIDPAEEAVKMADRLGDEELAWKTRFELLTAAVFGGAPEKALMTFAWLESKSAQDPERFPASKAVLGLYLSETDVLWGYKWVGLNLADFVEIARHDIESVLERMRVQYERHQVSLRPYWAVKARTHRSLGDDVAKIREAVTAFNTSPRDAYADCVACEWNFRVEMALLEGDVAGALKLADRLVDGNHRCAEVPHITFSTLVVPSWRAGFHDRARLFHQRGYEMCRDNKDFLVPICEHIDFRLMESDWAGAQAMLQRHAPWARDTRASWRRLRFLQTALAVARHAPSDGDLGLPTDFQPDDWKSGDADPSIDAWRAWLQAEVTQLAERFDKRNGNTAISDEAHRHLRDIAPAI